MKDTFSDHDPRIWKAVRKSYNEFHKEFMSNCEPLIVTATATEIFAIYINTNFGLQLTINDDGYIRNEYTITDESLFSFFILKYDNIL